MIQNLTTCRIGGVDPAEVEFQRLKADIHQELVESLDLVGFTPIDSSAVRSQVREHSRQLVRARRLKLDTSTLDRLLAEICDEVFGLGPLERLFQDSAVSDILVNHAHEVYVERRGRLERSDVIFADDRHVLRIIQRIVARVGRRIDEASPMVDARLEDGSRINAVVPPLAIGGPKLSIRRFGVQHLDLDFLLECGSLSANMATFLRGAVTARQSMVISGGTGAGKTTLLDALSMSIPSDERLVTVEDSAELILQHPHVVRLETRPRNTEGAGEISPRDLVRNSLRMRPDRIIVGEVRGPEALDMLQAMNTGHEGSLTTIHANDTHDALARLEMMVAMSRFDLPIPVVRQYIASGVRILVQLARLKGGVRRVMRVTEVLGVQGGEYRLEDIFGFRQEGLDDEGCARGSFFSTGYQPRCLDRFADCGVNLDSAIFQVNEA
jgi:pilus assembly protein CpaF